MRIKLLFQHYKQKVETSNVTHISVSQQRVRDLSRFWSVKYEVPFRQFFLILCFTAIAAG